ncbi:MAG: hypothetical protein KDC38_21025, partial [Planctomycetes bacterium]|nr:hypothetical protein [Planctomycetota bacterium]
LLEITETSDGHLFEIDPIDPGTSQTTVFVPADVVIALEEGGRIPRDTLAERVTCHVLTVTLDLDPADPTRSTGGRVIGDTFSGTVESIDRAAGRILVDGAWWSVDPLAEIIDLRGTQTASSFAQIEVGDRVTGYGLLACPGDAIHGTAFVILLLPSPSDGGEGCGHGYWKQSQHFDAWPTPYPPDLPFDEVFDDTFPGKSLVEVLQLPGGGLHALGRAAVAALLNAASPDVDYPLTADEVIQMFDDAVPGGGLQATKNELEALNDAGCPLN